MTNSQKLKDGREVTIRKINAADADKRHNFFVELSLNQRGMVHTVDEIDYHAGESLEHISSFLRLQKGLWLIALDQSGQVVGEIDITIKNLARVRHNGSLTMGILPDWQQVGLGSLLMIKALEWAQNCGLKRIDLFVFKSNIQAQNLYKKFGFVVEGVRKNFIKNEDGTFEDDILMAKYLN